jgi:WD40 repeat protein
VREFSDQTDSAVWTQDGELLIAGLSGSVLRSSAPGQPPQLVLPGGARTSTNFRPKLNPIGTWVVRADGPELQLVDLRTGASTKLGSSSTTSFVNFAGTNRVVVGRRDGTTEVREAGTGALEGTASGAAAYGGEVVGGTAVSITGDGRITVIDTTSEQQIAQLTLPRRTDLADSTAIGIATSIALTPDGYTLVAATSGGQVFLWSLRPESTMEAACSTAGHDLS